VNHAGVVLQHGSILRHRLPFDETDLLVGSHDRAGLRAATVTLEELGAPTGARSLAAALVEGFAEALDLSFTSTSTPAGRPGAEGLVEVEFGR
jgi:hypothetical protein